MGWHVYMLRCVDGSLYTGITTDLDRRVEEHNTGTKGARYTRARRPVSLVYSETSESRATASSREYAIKQLTSGAKAELVRSGAKQ
ncbi:MAG: GIY-YIG nuclease family protein [Gammaproteobacteria bacterium]|nr:GIY-YIG nuclease family protein [Gammaproteobacteria bacterium]